jgi:hypothetical protein
VPERVKRERRRSRRALTGALTGPGKARFAGLFESITAHGRERCYNRRVPSVTGTPSPAAPAAASAGGRRSRQARIARGEPSLSGLNPRVVELDPRVRADVDTPADPAAVESLWLGATNPPRPGA